MSWKQVRQDLQAEAVFILGTQAKVNTRGVPPEPEPKARAR